MKLFPMTSLPFNFKSNLEKSSRCHPNWDFDYKQNSILNYYINITLQTFFFNTQGLMYRLINIGNLIWFIIDTSKIIPIKNFKAS